MMDMLQLKTFSGSPETNHNTLLYTTYSTRHFSYLIRFIKQSRGKRKQARKLATVTK